MLFILQLNRTTFSISLGSSNADFPEKGVLKSLTFSKEKLRWSEVRPVIPL
jgi:hypothetical protein